MWKIAAASLLLLWSSAGIAGTEKIDTQGITPEKSDADWYDAFRSKIDGFDAPLFPAPDFADLPPTRCGPEPSSQTHAMLIGAGKGLEMRAFWLPGPANDVELFRNALSLRGAPEANIAALTGAQATLPYVRKTARGLLDKVNCNDSVIVHFSGFALNASAIGLPEGEGGPFGRSTKVKYLNEIGGFSMASAAADQAIEGAPFLLLNVDRPNTGAVISAAALSEYVTLLRNRGAHVSVILDGPSATDFDLEARQARIDPKLYPRLSLTTESADPGNEQTRWTPSLLSPRAGDFTVFYGTGRGSPGIERGLPPGAEDRTIYGLLSYQLATAISVSERTTVGALARHIRGQDSEKIRTQSYTFVTTNPDLDMIAEDRKQDVYRAPQIIIDSPEVTRAALKLSKPVIEISGRIDAKGRPIQVKINDSVAQPDGETGFISRYKLRTGVNTIKIHAITDENESLRYDFELYYEGDIREVIGQGKRYALIIANQDYEDGSGIRDLNTPIGDARAVRDVLTRKYGFQTEAIMPDGQKINLFLENAGLRDMALALGPLAKLAGPRDSVLIFYAGHGDYDSATGAAYWLPTDAVQGIPGTFFDAKTLNDTLQVMEAGNVIVISDSCYSGMLLRSTEEGGQPGIPSDARLQHLQKISESRSRVVLSSGGNTPVLDGGGSGHSIFARALLGALSEPEETAFSARELHNRVAQSFPTSIDQEPDFRRIYRAGHDGGDFVFLLQE